MAGNKAIYDTAMKRAHEHAWANAWDRAIKEYSRALAEFPDDRTALRNMAQSQFRLRQWPEALQAYQNLINAEPGDLFAMNRLAEINLALGQGEAAQATYNNLADLYVKGNQLHEAIRALRDLSRAMPSDAEAHRRLLKLTQEVGDRPAQVAEHLALSKLALDAGDLAEATRTADAAAQLDADNPEVRRWVYAVRRRAAEVNASGTQERDADATGRMSGVLGSAALPQIAEREAPEAAQLVEQATEAQNRGEFREAIDLYDQAVRAGAKRASVFYTAGLLNQQVGRHAVAIPFLERASKDPEFATSANYVIGQCYLALRNYPKAVVHLERALSLIDSTQLSRNEADELIELYTSTAEANLAEGNVGRAASLFTSLVNLFKEKRWVHPQLAELEKRADELYNKSIQSKLLGISRGSALLDQTLVISRQSSDLGENPTPDDATSRLRDGTSVIGSTDQSSVGSRQASDLGENPTPDTQHPTPDTRESGTAMMRRPGSSLRTITEFLRAADLPNTGDTSEERLHTGPVGQPGGLPAPLLSGPLTGEGHTFTTLSAPLLRDVEKQSMDVQRLLAEGEFAMGQEMWDSAIDACLAVMSIEPEYLPVHMMLGDIYLHTAKPEEAVAKYSMVMETYVARREPGSAATVCERLLQLEPGNLGLQTRLGMLLLEAGRVDDAASALLAVPESLHRAGEHQRALEETLSLKSKLPNSSEVALAIGTYLMSMGHSREALVELSRSLHLNPSNNLALVRLYVLLAKLNEAAQWDALQSLLERAAKDKGQTRQFMQELHGALQVKATPAIYYGLSVLAERSGMLDIAADALDQALLQISLSDTVELHNSWLLLEALMCRGRGDLAAREKDGAMAAQHYSRALDILEAHGAVGGEADSLLQSPRPQYGFLHLPEPTELYYGLAEAYASLGNWEGTLEALAALKPLMTNDYSVYTRMADIYFRQGQLNQALSELNELLVLYQKQGEHEKTLETLGHMARLAPNNIAVRRKFSDIYLKLGMTQYGLSELSTLAELQLKAGLLKDAMGSYRKAADLHYTLGQHDSAIQIYERIVRIAPRDIEARHQLINMYIQSGRIADAIAGERAMAEFFIHEGQAEGAIAALHQLLALSPEDVPAHHMLAKQLVSLEKYGEAARLYARLERLEPDNDRVPILHSEMLRMAKEATAVGSRQ